MRQIVGVADMKIAAKQGDELITYALGSCLGITIYDPRVGVGGMLHVMLPQSNVDPSKAAENPYIFVDTGVPKLFLDCYQEGAEKQRLIVKVAPRSIEMRAKTSFRLVNATLSCCASCCGKTACC